MRRRVSRYFPQPGMEFKRHDDEPYRTILYVREIDSGEDTIDEETEEKFSRYKYEIRAEGYTLTIMLGEETIIC